ncbi:hypothetical protein [Nocardia camponoti]|uniref:Tat (Twin-arginine translocation) pathway signal sequence n=1 Tax=Nocardia camponoti TaxID=1616106 RepID=A0A917V3Y7_9NOCA|nr:hypothetical protein [Nocardia camponoti]GGK34219.1 hypothetical protein GCM10011591_02420 [Nocardia camponoti]
MGLRSGRILPYVAAVVAAVAAVLFVVAPGPLASTTTAHFDTEADLRVALGSAFVKYWDSGRGELSPDLAAITDYWLRYHCVKAVLASALFAALIVVGVRVWSSVLSPAGLAAKVVRSVAGVAVALLGLVALVLAMVNVQGAIAPLASLLPMLVTDTTDPELAVTLDQVKSLADSPGWHGVPAIDRMVDDFTRYHVAMAALAAAVTLAALTTAVVLWRRARRAEGRETRWALGSFAAALGVVALSMAVVAVANTSTATDPAPALLTAFHGQW